MRAELLKLFGKQRSAELDIARLPGFMREYLELTTKCTDARPGLLLTAWLPFCAVNLGNRVYMFNNSTRIYPNIWSCVIGPSSISRKSTALRYATYTVQDYEDKLRGAALETYEKNTMILNGTTLSKLMSYLAVNPARLFVHNEIAGWLHDMNKSFNAGYKQVVTELFDGVDRTIANRERTEIITKPALSIAAASTEGWLFGSMMEGAEQLGGFLQRMLFYVVRNVNLGDMNLTTQSANDLEQSLAIFDERYFQWWRVLPGSFRLDLSEEALILRNELYEVRYKQYFIKNNDALMSYFTRIYDGYWFKFCILIVMAELCERRESVKQKDVEGCNKADYDVSKVQTDVTPFHDFHASTNTPLALVSAETAAQAFYLCDFYMENTIPLLEIMDEQDKLAGERKLIELLVNRFDGKALHSALLNASHMKKRDFKECIESLIEREAVIVETYISNTKPGKMYVLAQEIMDSWLGNNDRTEQ